MTKTGFDRGHTLSGHEPWHPSEVSHLDHPLRPLVQQGQGEPMTEVAALIDPDMLVEIECDAMAETT